MESASPTAPRALRFELPFYSSAAVSAHLAPLLGELSAEPETSAMLRDDFAEAANRALRQTLEEA